MKEQPTVKPEGVIPFEDFARTARTLIDYRPKDTTYNRSMREYTTDLVYCDARGWGHGKDKAAAQWDAIRKCYADYRKRIWRDNTLLALDRDLKAAEKRLRLNLNANNARLTRFRVSWDNNGEYYSRYVGYRRVHRSAWMVQISIDYEIDLSRVDGASEKGYAQFMALPSEIMGRLNKNIDEIINQDFAAVRFVARHELQLDWLRRQRRENWEKVPMIQAQDAKPGDVLVEEYMRAYFQVYSVSPTGSKIMVHWFWDTHGPTPLVRLKKDDQEKRYKRLAWDDFYRRFGPHNAVRYEAVKAAIETVKAKIGAG